jgi:CheY-like chemotaxis protein
MGEQVVGVIGISQVARHVVKICQFRLDPQWHHTSISRSMIDRVREYCWSQGCLKLVVETGSVPGWMLGMLGRRGFRLVRQHAVEGKSTHEFYLNLYHKTSAKPQHGLRVLLADDHSVLLKGMSDLLREQPEVEVVGEAHDGQEAVDLAFQVRPDVVLMDVTMPRMDGIEATRRITSQLPNCRVIGLSMHKETEVATAMREAGAAEYLWKGESSDRIVAAVLQRA